MNSDRPRYRRWALRALLALLALECAWLLGVNLALSVPATQAWLNTLRPERFQLAWEKAWSWYPGRVRAEGVRVSGQTPRQQWQAEAERVEGNVALLPLVLRRVHVNRARVENAHYRQRPRLEAGKDYGDALAWFPEIEGYEIAPQGDYPPVKPVWTVKVHGARLAGRHEAWIQRVHAAFEASATVHVETRSQGGPLALDIPALEIDIERAWADDDETVLDAGRVTGAYRLGPYRYREHRGLRSLRFTDLDLDVALEAGDLAFVRLFLLKYPALQTAGRGTVEGHLALRGGRVSEGTRLGVDAADLAVAQAPFTATGRGAVDLAATDDDALPFAMTFRFDDLAVLHSDDRAPFFTGRGLRIAIDDDGHLVPRDDAAPGDVPSFRADLAIDDALVDDMRTFNRYLPPDAALAFTGGSADLVAKLALTADDASGEFTLRGEDLRATAAGQELGLALRFDGVVAGGRPPERLFDLSGSKLTLEKAWVVGEEDRFEEDDWSAGALLEEATLVLERPVDLSVTTRLSVSDTRPLAAVFINNGGPAWIGRRVRFDDITGVARLRLHDRRLYVPEASLSAEHLEAALRGTIGAPASEGMVYLRYRRLDALLQFAGEETDITVFDPKDKFEAYEVTLPAMP